MRRGCCLLASCSAKGSYPWIFRVVKAGPVPAGKFVAIVLGEVCCLTFCGGDYCGLFNWLNWPRKNTFGL